MAMAWLLGVTHRMAPLGILKEVSCYGWPVIVIPLNQSFHDWPSFIGYAFMYFVHDLVGFTFVKEFKNYSISTLLIQFVTYRDIIQSPFLQFEAGSSRWILQIVNQHSLP